MSFVSEYKDQINDLISCHLNLYFKENDSNLKNIIIYTLNNGQRIRPSISMDIYKSLTGKNNNFENFFSILSIEYIHTASLIIDDLPCMDNAEVRRKQPCIHVCYGEAIAQISSVILMSLAMDTIYRTNTESFEPNELNKIGMFFLQNFSKTIGNNGASGGQLLDLAAVNTDIGNVLKKECEKIDTTEIIEKKTGSFFETSFLIGYLYGGGDFNNISQIKKIANIFGMIYQIVDDIEDYEEDLKTNKKNITQNYAIRHGKIKAKEDTLKFITEFKNEMTKNNLYSNFFDSIINYLKRNLK
jgi:geranylgeranyl diphosphate synthase type II